MGGTFKSKAEVGIAKEKPHSALWGAAGYRSPECPRHPFHEQYLIAHASYVKTTQDDKKIWGSIYLSYANIGGRLGNSLDALFKPKCLLHLDPFSF